MTSAKDLQNALKISLDDDRFNYEIKKTDKEIQQWVSKVMSSSSEANGWPATNIVGPSNTYPKYGDSKTNWSPFSSSGTQEFLHVKYDIPVIPTRIKVYETYNPGALVKVSGKDPSDNWVILWSGARQTNSGKAVINELPLKKVDFLVSEILLDLNCMGQTGYYEIDAIELFGYQAALSTIISMHQSFGTWYLNPEFSDLTFVVGNSKTKLPGHKFILANVSPKLNALVSDAKELVVDFPVEHFKKVLKYLYTGRHSLCKGNNDIILKIANTYDIVGLRKACFDFMVSTLDKDKLIETLLKAKNKEFDFDASDLVLRCVDSIKEKAFEIFPENYIFNFDKDLMVMLCSSDEMTIDEYDLFESVLRWGEKKRGEQSLKDFCGELMKYIRFPLMDPRLLHDKVKSSKHYGTLLTEDQYIEALEYNLDPSFFKDDRNPQFRDRNKLFKGSSLLTARLSAALFKMLPSTNSGTDSGKHWMVCYKGSRDGFEAGSFHKCCDNKGKSITVIQSSNGNIFGGYNPDSWTMNGGYSTDVSSFLFTLVNKEGWCPWKISKQAGKNGAYSSSSYGPTFGTGHDIYICTNAAASNSNYSNFGASYILPPGFTDEGKKKKLLAGSYNFTVKEIEVLILG